VTYLTLTLWILTRDLSDIDTVWIPTRDLFDIDFDTV
jgi:hypothetical protein